MESEELNLLNQKKQHLTAWEQGLKSAEDARPFVERTREMTDLEIEMVQNAPKTLGPQPFPGLVEKLRRENQYLAEVLPPMPRYDLNNAATTNAMATAGTASVYGQLHILTVSPDAELRSYGQTYLMKYDDLQKTQERPAEARIMVAKLKSPPLLKSFDKTAKACLEVKMGTGTTTSAASEMRNLLYGIQGELFDMSRYKPKEKMSWSEMSKRLAKPGPGDVLRHELDAQESVYKALTDRLSPLAKGRVPVSCEEINRTFTRVLDFIFTTLGLVDFHQGGHDQEASSLS